MTAQSLIRLVLLGLAALLLFPPFSQTAMADTIMDFSCGAATCSGTVQESVSGTDFSTAGISVFFQGQGAAAGFYSGAATFVLKFNTATNSISVNGTGGLAGEVFQGTINGFSFTEPPQGTNLDINFFSALWGTLPADVQTLFGFPTGIGSGFVIAIDSTGKATSVDIPITPTPEPGTLALIGSGLLGVAAARRRKRNSVA